MFPKFEKRPKGTLVKQQDLSPKEFYYRLASEEAGYDRENIPLDEYYEASVPIKARQERALLFYATAIAALLFYFLGKLEEFSFSGVKLNDAVMGHGLLALSALANFQYALTTAKLQRYQSLFHYIYDTGNGARKQDLLLRYPSMFTSFMYFNRMSGGPANMLPKRAYSYRVIIFLVLLVPAVMAWFFSVAYLMIYVSVDIWGAGAVAKESWSKVWIIGCWGLFGASWLLPTLSFFKIRFQHFGMTSLLERVRERDPSRYGKYLRMIDSLPLGRRAFEGEER